MTDNIDSDFGAAADSPDTQGLVFEADNHIDLDFGAAAGSLDTQGLVFEADNHDVDSDIGDAD